MEALGMIETRGLVAAIESADVMLKAADVGLAGKTLVGGGLVTVCVCGEVAAVKAAVDAGVAAVEKLGATALISSHVIPRPDNAVGILFPKGATDNSAKVAVLIYVLSTNRTHLWRFGLCLKIKNL